MINSQGKVNLIKEGKKKALMRLFNARKLLITV